MNVTIDFYPNRLAEELLEVSTKTRQRDFKILRRNFSADDFPVPKNSKGLTQEAFELWSRYRFLVTQRGQKLAIKQLIREIQS